MGYQPLKSFKYVFDKMNTISGSIVVKAENENEANKLIKKLKIQDLVSFNSEVASKSTPLKLR